MEKKSGKEVPVTFPHYILRNANLYSDKVAYREKELGIWQSYTWLQSLEQIRDLANGLAALGFKRGDIIAVVGDNRPQLYWGIIAAQCLGGVPVPLYQDSIEREMEFVVKHAEAKFALVEDQEQADKFLNIIKSCPKLKTVIYDDPRGLGKYDLEYLIGYDQVQAKGREFASKKPDYFQKEVDKGKAEDLAVICYTSGTTGQPKGVMLTFGNLLESAKNFAQFENFTVNDNFIAYLPMAWVGDYFLSVAQVLECGCAVNCPESGATVLNDIREIGPSFFFAPPRIFENLLTSMMIRMEDSGKFKKILFDYFMATAKSIQHKKQSNQSISLKDRILYALGNIFIYGPLKDSIGFGKVRVAYTAGEAMGPEIFDFFRSMGVNLKQVYGLTEGGVFVSAPLTGGIKSDTCGPILPWVEVRFSDTGEVEFKSPGAFVGYYKNKKATAETKSGDWVKTGDAGFLDHDGHLKIIDRAKDVSKLSNGTIFSPKFLENKMKFSPFIKEAVSIGMKKPYVTAFINIDLEAVGSWAERKNFSYTGYTDLAQNEEVYKLITGEIEKVNQSLSLEDNLQGAQVRKFLILHKELDPDDEEITRTRKVRRGFINEKYKKLITALYKDQTTVEVKAQVTFEDGRTSTVNANLKIQHMEEVA